MTEVSDTENINIHDLSVKKSIFFSSIPIYYNSKGNYILL